MSHSGVSEYQLRLRSHVSGYSESPDSASVHVHAYPVYPADESATFWILSPEWRFFNPLCISKRVNRSTSSLPWILNIQDGPSKEKIADSKISGYVWTGKFVLYPDTCGRGNVCVRKEKVECSKISGCLWMASKERQQKTCDKKTNKQTMIRIVVDLGQKRLDQSRTKPRLALVLDALPYLIKWEPLVIHFTFTSFEGPDQSPSTPPYLIPYQHLLSGSGQFMSAPLTPPLTLPVSRLKVWISAPPYLTLPVSQLKVLVWISAPPYLTLPVSRVKVWISAPPYYTLPYQYLDSRSG